MHFLKYSANIVDGIEQILIGFEGLLQNRNAGELK